MPHSAAAYFLVGPTASGKTAVAEALAHRLGAFVLSADSMLVYRGMDIGTAKPGPSERAGGRLRGIDLADPDEPFSTGRWLLAASNAFTQAAAEGRDVIVAGGTGLYVSALLRGLDAPPASAEIRAEVAAVFKAGGSAALAEKAEKLRPGSTAKIDSANPRRLARLVEILLGGGEVPHQTADREASGTGAAILAGLDFDPPALRERIAARAEAMFAGGALQREVEGLCAMHPGFENSTAGGGIGYAEALALVRGEMSADEALQRTIFRTTRLAKRQRTWWRKQASVQWVRGPADGSDVERAADDVAAIWKRHGKTPVVLP